MSEPNENPPANPPANQVPPDNQMPPVEPGRSIYTVLPPDLQAEVLTQAMYSIMTAEDRLADSIRALRRRQNVGELEYRTGNLQTPAMIHHIRIDNPVFAERLDRNQDLYERLDRAIERRRREINEGRDREFPILDRLSDLQFRRPNDDMDPDPDAGLSA